MSWPAVALGDVVTTRGGGTPPRGNATYFGGSIPWITPKDMKASELRSSQISLTPAGLASSAASLVPADSVLIVTRSGVLKHSLPVAINRVPVAVNQDMRALIPTSDIETNFLAQLLRSKAPIILRWVRSTTADNFPFGRLLDLQITLPPRDEQRRIAHMLDLVDGLRVARRRSLECARGLSGAIFQAMFGALGLPSGRLADVVREFRYGTSNKSGTSGYPVLRIPNVVGQELDLTAIKLVALTTAELRRLSLEEGDVLFVRSNGNPNYVGRCSMFSREAVRAAGLSPDGVVFASYLIRARLDQGRVEPVFVREYLASADGRRMLRSRCKTSAGQYNINIEGLGSVELPMPPLSLQSDFTSRVTRIQVHRDCSIRQLALLDRMFEALQHHAFSGAV